LEGLPDPPVTLGTLAGTIQGGWTPTLLARRDLCDVVLFGHEDAIGAHASGTIEQRFPPTLFTRVLYCCHGSIALADSHGNRLKTLGSASFFLVGHTVLRIGHKRQPSFALVSNVTTQAIASATAHGSLTATLSTGVPWSVHAGEFGQSMA
jgi:hypothetical protein